MPALEGDLTAALPAAGRQALRDFSVGDPLTAGFRIELVANTGEAISEELGLMGPRHCWGWKAGALPGRRRGAWGNKKQKS